MSGVPAAWYRYDDERGVLVLALHVQPGAKSTGIAGLHGERLKVRLAAPAVDGRANAALVAFLADRFDLPGGQVMIRSGDHGRSKTIEIHGRADRLLARVKELLQA